MPLNFMQRSLLAAGLVLALAGCDGEAVPPTAVEGTGSIEGVLFLDADENGFFDPAGGDQPLSGVQLRVRERGGTGVLGSPTTTDASGRFSITGLPLGTHEIVFDESTIPEGASVCQNPVPVSVLLNEATFANVAGRPACLISIAEAQQAEVGTFVIIRGIVTSFPNQHEPNFTIIEDETGGILLFGSQLNGAGIQNGDLIEVGGTVTEFSGRLELEGLDLREHIPGVGELTPEVTTIATLAAATSARDPLQNRLFTIQKAQLATGFTSGGSRNATITDATGSMVMRVEDNVSSGNGDAILSTLGIAVGKCYDITGILGAFNGTPQIFPRQASDLVEVPCS